MSTKIKVESIQLFTFIFQVRILEKGSKTKGTRRFPSSITRSTLLFELAKTKIIYKRKDEIFNGFHLHIIMIMNSKVMIGRKKFFHIKFTRYKEDEIFTL
jgi:hypothetical protein